MSEILICSAILFVFGFFGVMAFIASLNDSNYYSEYIDLVVAVTSLFLLYMSGFLYHLYIIQIYTP